MGKKKENYSKANVSNYRMPELYVYHAHIDIFLQRIANGDFSKGILRLQTKTTISISHI